MSFEGDPKRCFILRSPKGRVTRPHVDLIHRVPSQLQRGELGSDWRMCQDGPEGRLGRIHVPWAQRWVMPGFVRSSNYIGSLISISLCIELIWKWISLIHFFFFFFSSNSIWVSFISPIHYFSFSISFQVLQDLEVMIYTPIFPIIGGREFRWRRLDGEKGRKIMDLCEEKDVRGERWSFFMIIIIMRIVTVEPYI